MDASRRDKVRALLAEAQSVPPEERAAFLRERCEEESVREEVASLLAAQDDASGFYEALADSVVAPMLVELDAGGTEDARPEDADPLGLEGAVVGGYAVEEHLGGGGMGIVYRARDPELGRSVALKFLPPHLSTHPDAEARFVREARAAAALEHPTVGTVHDIGETEEGRRFIAMAYYEGETLKERIGRDGPLPLAEALDYAGQIAEALAQAHEAGIVHRDVKPANVMITERGEVKLLDFGLARLMESTRLTGTGQQLGTVGYMSPEQVEGETVGPAADLWALGALLYEMLAGERPFQGERRVAVLHAVLHETPAPLPERRPELPAAVAQVVHRCLQKDPADRYASAAALRADLQALRAGEAPAAGESASLWASTKLLGGARGAVALAVVVVAAGIAAFGWGLWPEGEEAAQLDRSVAVLPFEVSGSGAETWRDGMVTTLTLNLDGAAGLRAITDRTVFATLEERGLSAGDIGMQDALDVARGLDARYAVIGSAVQLGEDLRFGAEVWRTADEERLGTVEVEGPPNTVTALTDKLTRRVLGVLLERSEERMPTVDLENITTESLAALKSYLDGERRFRAGEYQAAASNFKQAVKEDSTFALAYARLYYSMIWGGLFEEGPRLQLERAYELSGRLPRRERRLVQSQHAWDVQNRALRARDSLRRFTGLYPEDPRMWHELGEVLFHGSVPGSWPEAEQAFAKAAELDPGVAHHHHHLVDLAMSLHRDSALAARRIAAHPPGDYKQAYQVALDLVFGAGEEEQQIYGRVEKVPSSVPYFWVRDGLAHPVDHQLQTEVFRALNERSGPDSDVYAAFLAVNRLRGGQVEEAMSLLRAEGVTFPTAACHVALPMSLGAPISESIPRSYRESSGAGDEASPERLLCAGIYYLERGRDEKSDSLLARLRARRQEADGPDAAGVQGALNELQGYRAWTEGEAKRAARLWSTSKRPFRPGAAIWRGDLYRDLGRLEEAEDWYMAAWQLPIAHERLGRLYEEMGRLEKGREAYRRFVEAWKNADPELQPRVEKARQRLRALRK